MSQALPFSATGLVEEGKVVNYLLNLAHADGCSKAKFFLARGFQANAWQVMRESLLAQGRNSLVTKITETEWGDRYQVDCHCPTPDGLNPCIRTIWEIAAGQHVPRLLTAYPLSH